MIVPVWQHQSFVHANMMHALIEIEVTFSYSLVYVLVVDLMDHERRLRLVFSHDHKTILIHIVEVVNTYESSALVMSRS